MFTERERKLVMDALLDKYSKLSVEISRLHGQPNSAFAIGQLREQRTAINKLIDKLDSL